MNEKEIRSFLVRTPRPARIIVQTDDDEIQELSPPQGAGQSWAAIAGTIAALKPKLIQVYDSDGKLARATNPADDDEPKNAALPALVATSDPETVRLTHFANLLYRATEFSTNVAFTKMVELFEIAERRSERVEARLERVEKDYRAAMNERIQDAFDEARAAQEAGGVAASPIAQMAQEFLAGFLQGGTAPPMPPAPVNGKAGKA